MIFSDDIHDDNIFDDIYNDIEIFDYSFHKNDIDIYNDIHNDNHIDIHHNFDNDNNINTQQNFPLYLLFIFFNIKVSFIKPLNKFHIFVVIRIFTLVPFIRA